MSTNNTLLAASYERVSTEEQAKEGFSLEAQSDANKRIIASEEWNYYRSFIDPGVSGKNLKRKGVQALLKAIEDGIVQIVVVHKLDRLTRNVGDLNYLIGFFEKHNVKLVSVSEKLDTSTAMGRMFVFMLGIFAQWYRENLSEEVIKGMSKRAEKGFHNVTVNLYGYERDEEGNLLIVEEEAKWVKWIFDQYIAGKGTTMIAKELNQIGIRRNQGAKWDQHKAMMTITNLHYTGMIHWKEASLPEEKRIVRQGTHEPIISMETYEKAQRILERRREGLISMNSYDYVFGGIIKCGKCGASYNGKYNKQTRRNGAEALYRGYSCFNKDKLGTCNQSGIAEDKLAKLLFSNVDLLIHNLSHTYESQIIDDHGLADLERMLTQSELKRARWQHAYGDGLMNYDDFANRMKEEMENVKELNKQIAEVAPTHTPTISPEEAVYTLKFIKENWGKIGQLERKQVIQALFQKIVITKEGKNWTITELVTV